MAEFKHRLRRSRVLEKLRRGEATYMTKLNLSDPRAAEVAASSGFDVLWLDMEHTGSTIEQIENQVRAAKVYDTDVMVRVSRGNYSNLIRPLELDATGIMVPHCMSAEDARQIVYHTRFHPLGRRPLDGGNADGSYTRIDLPDYIAQANDQRFIVLQIEDPEAMEELDEIAAVPGYDVLLFGAGDFSHAVGDPGNMAHPAVVDAKKRIGEACKKHGKVAGCITTVANRDKDIELGYRFLSLGADVVALSTYWGALTSDLGIADRARDSTSGYSGR